MPIVYPVKIKYKDGLIIGLVSPHLRIDFITRYTESTNELSSTNLALPAEKLKIEDLQIIIENYVRWIQDNNYILRLPNHPQVELFQQGEQWINVEINTPVKKGTFERLGEVIGISLFVVTLVLDEFFFVLAARINKISYKTLILPILADFTMAGIIYAYSGAASNIVDKGKELDDWWYSKKLSSTETELETEHSFLSLWNLSRFLLCILPVANTIFQSFGYWQSMMSMRNQFKASNPNDPIITPGFIYNLAIVVTAMGSIYEVVQLTSYALKATNTVKDFLDKCNNVCGKCINYMRGERYIEVLTDERQIESEIDDIINTNPSTAISPFSIKRQTKASGNEQDVAAFFITNVVYNNLLINKDILFEVNRIGGIKAVQNIINLGEDYEVASTIIEYIRQYGLKHVMKILFSDVIKNYKVEVDLSYNQVVAIAEDEAANKYSEMFALSDVEKIVSNIIEQNFFLNNERGRNFIQAVVKTLDTEDLLAILELGKDSDIAEHVLSEVGEQSIENVVYILLGKGAPVVGATDNLENILGQQELNHLQLVPNGIFNAWSNKAYHRIANYIDNLAKNLDDMLNTGKSGNQVTIVVALLEEWLGLAASGQRFVGEMPPYYDPDHDDDWSNGGGGSNDGDHNSSAGIFDNQNIFTVLLAYNGADYNITDHQM
jgi:hypothetical protein